MSSVYVGSARGDEQGGAKGGRAGDQTGREVSTQKWYRHEKGWRTLRAKDAAAREKLAEAMEAACANAHIGYDQWQRDTLLKEAAKVQYDVSRVEKDCETDCSALTRVCCAYAFGWDVAGEVSAARFYTGNLTEVLLKTGLFDELQGTQYSDRCDYLMRGDIQCTRTQGHVVIVLNDGALAGQEGVRPVLRRGASGEDVREMQRMLMKAGGELGAWGADGRFGAATEKAVLTFQKEQRLEQDGVCGPLTWGALEEAALQEGRWVVIRGGNCYVRSGPGVTYPAIGVAMKGERLVYAGRTDGGWLCVESGGRTGWVSGRYGHPEAEDG